MHPIDDGKRPGMRRFAAAMLVSLVIALAIQGPAGGHDNGTTGHLWDVHIEPLRDPGTINAAGNPLHWTKLKGVPSGFADGTDNLALAGVGLQQTLIGLAIDPEVTQRRVDGTCPGGQAIRSVSQSGDVSCTRGPQALSFTDDDTGIICNTGCIEGSLALPAGTWVITAKINIYNTSESVAEVLGRCELRAGGEVDESGVFVAGLSDFGTNEGATIPMQLLATLPDPGFARVFCLDQDHGNQRGSDLSIIAMRVAA
jgi:hypothetical protein